MTYACTCRKGSSSFCEDIIAYYATRNALFIFRVVKVEERWQLQSRRVQVGDAQVVS